MEVVKAIYQRRAVRSYTGESVERECIERLIDAAIQAPSAHNAQPWAFCATNDRALMQHIAHESRAHLLRHLPPHSSLPQLMPTLLDEECDIFYGAAAFIVVSATSDDTWAAEACGMAAQNLMLAACAEGLASCCIGLAAVARTAGEQGPARRARQPPATAADRRRPPVADADRRLLTARAGTALDGQRTHRAALRGV